MTLVTGDRIPTRSGPHPVADWVPVCPLADLTPGTGRAVDLRGVSVALIRSEDDQVFAVQHREPHSGAMVIAGGEIRILGELTTITAPRSGQVFELHTGFCLDPAGREPVVLRTWPVRIDDDVVSLGVRPLPQT